MPNERSAIGGGSVVSAPHLGSRQTDAGGQGIDDEIAVRAWRRLASIYLTEVMGAVSLIETTSISQCGVMRGP